MYMFKFRSPFSKERVGIAAPPPSRVLTESQKRLLKAEIMSKYQNKFYDKQLAGIIDPPPPTPPSPFINDNKGNRGIPVTTGDEINRINYGIDKHGYNSELTNNRRLRKMLTRAREINMESLNSNYGLVVADTKNPLLPQDLVMHQISPFLQPHLTDNIRPNRNPLDISYTRSMDYPTYAPPQNSNLSPYSYAGTVPNLGFVNLQS